MMKGSLHRAKPRRARVCDALAPLIALTALLGAPQALFPQQGESAPFERDAAVAQALKALGADEFAARRDAEDRLVALGPKRLEAGLPAHPFEDPEVRARVERARFRARWGLTRPLLERIGTLWDDYETLPRHRKFQRVLEVGALGGDTVEPWLRALAQHESDPLVREFARQYGFALGVHLSQAQALIAAGKLEDARRLLLEAMAVPHPARSQTATLLARLSMLQGRREDAELMIAELAREDPAALEALREDAHLAPLLDAPPVKAVLLGRKGLKLLSGEREAPAPDKAEAPPAPETPLQRDERLRAAAQALTESVALNPRDAVNCYNLACAHALLGESTKAVQALERAIAAGYRDYAWMQEDEDLKSLRERADFQGLVRQLRGLEAPPSDAAPKTPPEAPPSDAAPPQAPDSPLPTAPKDS